MAQAIRRRRVLILIAVLAVIVCTSLAAMIARLDGRESTLSFQLQFIGVVSAIAVVVAYVVLPSTLKGQRVWVGEDFILTEPAPQGYSQQAKFDDIVRVILNVSRGRITGATVVARGVLVRIGYVKTPALVVRAILDRAPENVKWWRSWPPFVRLSRDAVRQMLDQADTPDVYALLPPGRTYSRVDEMFSRDGPPEPLPGRRGLFGPKMGWPLNIRSPVLSTPARRYANFMLMQMCRTGETFRVVKRSEPLPPITLGTDTAAPPSLEDVLSRLKFMCNVKGTRSAGVMEGTTELFIQRSPHKLLCRFDDDADVCCEIHLEAMDVE